MRQEVMQASTTNIRQNDSEPLSRRIGYPSSRLPVSLARPLRVFYMFPPFTMPSKKTATAATDSTAVVPLSTDFCADDADVVIRASGTLDFRVHKAIDRKSVV